MDRLIDNFLFQKDKENLSSLMDPPTKEHGKMVWCMVLEFINGKMDPNIKAIMWMVKNKETESFITHQVNNISECGQTANKKEKVK